MPKAYMWKHSEDFLGGTVPATFQKEIKREMYAPQK